MLKQIDHVVVLVSSLAEAIEAYRRHGFHVVPGGEHPGGTHNALIGFADGAYFELLAFREPERPHVHRWYRYLTSGPGIIDVCLASDDLDADVERLRQRGLPYREPDEGSRQRPDGVLVRWRGATPSDERTGALPFLIQDVTPRETRVPSGDDARHPLGVVGIAAVTVAVHDLDAAVREYRSLLDVGELVERSTDPSLRARTAAFALGPHRIVLAQPADTSGPVAERLCRRGEGPLQVSVRAPETAEPRQLDVLGARVLLLPG